MKYQYGLSNYILHELGVNLENSDSAIKNEEKIFKKLNESERIDKEIGKIKKKYNTKIIYGGSVNSENIKDIVKICDGVIAGKMSLNVEIFKNIIRQI